MEDVLFIRKGIFGQEWILARWPKLQAVSISQSLYQRQKGLANLSLSTAGGTITINFISLEAARALADYALYKVESSNTGWM